MAFYPKSVAYTRMFKLISSVDHVSKLTGATATVNISKAGAAFGAAAGTVTEVGQGWYKVALTTADTGTAGDLAFYITAAGADDTDFVDQVMDTTVASVGVNAVTISNAAISTTTFAAGAIDTNALAASAVTKIWATTLVDLAAVPTATDTMVNGMSFLFMLGRNKVTQTSTTQLLLKDDSATTAGTSTVSDDGTTFTRGKFA